MKALSCGLGSAVIAVLMIGCASADPQGRDKETAKAMLGKQQNVTLSGLTGAVKGGQEDARLRAAASPVGDYPQDSLRHYLVKRCAATGNLECLALLKSRKDVVIDGKTGEIQGCAGVKAGVAICPHCKFPVGSPGCMILTREDATWDD